MLKAITSRCGGAPDTTCSTPAGNTEFFSITFLILILLDSSSEPPSRRKVVKKIEELLPQVKATAETPVGHLTVDGPSRNFLIRFLVLLGNLKDNLRRVEGGTSYPCGDSTLSSITKMSSGSPTTSSGFNFSHSGGNIIYLYNLTYYLTNNKYNN